MNDTCCEAAFYNKRTDHKRSKTRHRLPPHRHEIDWTTPVLVATQLKMNLGSIHEVQTVFLRAMPRYQGIVVHDCIKVWLDEDNNEGATINSVYFGKCMLFLHDSEGKQFVIIQWFHRHENNGFVCVPSFKLAPEAHTNSYSTLPLAAIFNGALMVRGGGRYWALLAPKEKKMYARLYNNLFPH